MSGVWIVEERPAVDECVAEHSRVTAELLDVDSTFAAVLLPSFLVPGIVSDTQSFNFSGLGHPSKLVSAEGQMVPSGQHWFPAHALPPDGQGTEAPTE
eukprot:CAMPEP_0181492140 /NCGR_PEP_ID=MMETSP1110-20121109/50517_1 /TAXON_ID=174948 /ORGANISM="Symbiodinium sp., Strain CCMP421" /LENGTH=97 /DNA_ID=CAMNT_0023619341 /DNA_START=150 /DNA_END=441 /DNA_ORIENTATION=+